MWNELLEIGLEEEALREAMPIDDEDADAYSYSIGVSTELICLS